MSYTKYILGIYQVYRYAAKFAVPAVQTVQPHIWVDISAAFGVWRLPSGGWRGGGSERAIK